MAPTTGAAVDSGCYGILFEDSRREGGGDAEPRDCHLDLQVDQVMTTLAEGNDPYWPRPSFCSPLSDPALLTLRQGILDDFGDLDDAGLDGVLMASSHGFSEVVELFDIGQRHVYDNVERDRWHLNAAEQYCRFVGRLSAELSRLSPQSLALQERTALVHALAGSESLRDLRDEALALQARLGAVEYAVLLPGTRITVGTYAGEPNYAREVVETVARFRQTLVGSAEFVEVERFDEPGSLAARHRDGTSPDHAPLRAVAERRHRRTSRQDDAGHMRSDVKVDVASLFGRHGWSVN